MKPTTQIEPASLKLVVGVPSALAGLLWTTTDSASYAPGFDGNGNIIVWIDLSDGSFAGSAEYRAFGETLVLVSNSR